MRGPLQTGRASSSRMNQRLRSTQKRAQIVMDLLRKLAVDQDFAAIIAVTHDEKIFDRFDDIFLLRDGRLEGETAARTVAT